MTASGARSVVSSEYTLGEEIANSITSGIASAISVAAFVVMVVHAALRGDGWHVTGRREHVACPPARRRGCRRPRERRRLACPGAARMLGSCYPADVTVVPLDLDRYGGGSPGGLTSLSEAGERVGGRRHHQVAYGNVEKGTPHDEIGSDRYEPGRRHVAPDHGPPSQDREPDDHLHHTREVHEGLARDGQDGLSGGAQVAWPVGQQVEELVEPCQERHDPEGH